MGLGFKSRYGRNGFIRDEAGSILPLTAVMLPVILGMVGIGVDVSVWLMEKRNLQSAADAAVIAAAWEVANGDEGEMVEDAALREAQNNGYTGDSVNLVYGTDASGNTTITTTLTQSSQVYFANFIFNGDIAPAAKASTAVMRMPGDFCMLSLDPDDSGALTINGNVTIDSTGCGIAVNSNHPTAALQVNGGSSDITVGDVSVVGGIDDQHDSFEAPSIATGVSPFFDPYENLETPDFAGCSEDEMNDGPVAATVTLDPGVYCGGLSFSGNNDYVLNPGVYFIDGGDFSSSGNGSITGEGVTIILTNSGGEEYGTYGNMSISGGKNVSLTAPLAGDLPEDQDDFEGVAIYQDRNAPESEQCNSLLGNAQVEVSGTAYFPTRCLDIGGASGASSPELCSRVIAQKITLHGNPAITNDCEGSAAEDIGRYSVRLIL